MNTTADHQFALLDQLSAQIIYGDTLSEIVDQLIDGYRDLPEGQDGSDPRLVARAKALGEAIARAQAVHLAAVGIDGLGEDALTILMHDRSLHTADFEAWDSEIPLILDASSYAPFTDIPRPAGDAIVWLNAHTELSLVQSLQRIGLVELLEKSQEDPPQG